MIVVETVGRVGNSAPGSRLEVGTSLQSFQRFQSVQSINNGAKRPNFLFLVTFFLLLKTAGGAFI